MRPATGFVLTAALLLGACRSTASVGVGSDILRLPADTTLAQLVDRWGASEGVQLSWSERAALRADDAAGFLSTIELPSSRVGAVARAVLAQHQLQLAPAEDGLMILVSVEAQEAACQPLDPVALSVAGPEVSAVRRALIVPCSDQELSALRQLLAGAGLTAIDLGGRQVRLEGREDALVQVARLLQVVQEQEESVSNGLGEHP